MNSLKKIVLKNFKSYKYQDFEISNLTVFCGNNSVGKSTAIQALGILLQSNFSHDAEICGELVNIGNIDDIHNYENNSVDELIIEVCFSSTPNRSFKWGYENSESRESLLKSKSLPLVSGDLNSLKKDTNDSNVIKFQYLHAERFGPRDNLPLSMHNYHSNWIGTKGEHTISVLENILNERRCNLTSDSDNSYRKHVSVDNLDIFKNIEAWMHEISPGHKINPQKIIEANIAFNTITPLNGQKTKPINIGFGFSYALSVVTALMLAEPNEIVIIENPEAHLHPKGQSFLGRLIALTAEDGVQVMIETHSDHVINGIRLMVRAGLVQDKGINFYHIYQINGITAAKKIILNSLGQFSEWPDEFFDQQAIDMDMLISGTI